MGAFFGLIFGLYFIGVMLTWPYFWAKKTDRSQAPIVRRGLGLAYAFGWPYQTFAYFNGKQQSQAAGAERSVAHDRIIGGGPPQPSTDRDEPMPFKIQNPFDS